MEAMDAWPAASRTTSTICSTVIGGYTKLALANLPDEGRAYHYIAEANQAVSHAESLTRQLLAFCRNQALHPAVVDLNDLVRETVKLVPRLLGTNIELTVTLADDLSPIRVDSGQIVQVLINLTLNARDAMPEGGRLEIRTAMIGAADAPQVSLQIGDSGTGMDQETQAHIFEPFFTTKPVGQGTGLGLSTVQGIVEQSGGFIEVLSHPGQGTRFQIYLPALAAAQIHEKAVAEIRALPGSETVLVVEDQAEVRDFVVAVLDSYGYKVVGAANAGEALLICEREGERIHLLLTDLTLRGISGREVARDMRRLRPGIAVMHMLAKPIRKRWRN